MELLFADPSLQAIAESTVRSDAYFGPHDAALLRQRLCELMAADNLGVAAALPTLGVERANSRDGEFAVALRKGWRLVVEVAGAIPRVSSNSAVDLQKVQSIRVVTVEECDES